MKYNRMPYGN